MMLMHPSLNKPSAQGDAYKKIYSTIHVVDKNRVHLNHSLFDAGLSLAILIGYGICVSLTALGD
jgi:hypothetical protein